MKQNIKKHKLFNTLSDIFFALSPLFAMILLLVLIFYFSHQSSLSQWEQVSSAIDYAIENEYTLLLDGVPVDLESLDTSSMPNVYSVKYINDETQTVYLNRNVRSGIY